MSKNLTFLAVAVLALFSGFAGKVKAEEPSGMGEVIKRDGFASITQVETGDLKADFNIGSCPAGKKVKAYLSLHNPSEFDLPIQGMSTSCSCLKAVTDAKVIPAGEAVEIVVSLEIPKHSKTAEQFLDMFLAYDPEQKIHLQIAFSLSGLVSFTGNGFATDVPFKAEVHRFRIPVVVTAPAMLANLEIETSDLGETTCRPVSENGQQYIECEIPMNGSTKVGSISIRDPFTRNTGIITCVVRTTSPIVVAPSILRFQPDPEKPEETIATGIIRLAESTLALRGGDENSVEAPPQIRWTLDGSKVEVELKRLSKGIYRAFFRMRLSEGDDSGNREPVPKRLVGVYKTNVGIFKKEIDLVLAD